MARFYCKVWVPCPGIFEPAAFPFLCNNLTHELLGIDGILLLRGLHLLLGGKGKLTKSFQKKNARTCKFLFQVF